MRFHIVATALLLSCAGPVLAQTPQAASSEERTTTVVRADGPIAVDGRLDEPAWQAAPATRGFIQNEPREGDAATFDTEVRIVYDDEAIYFGVVAADSEPSRIIVADLKKDYAVDGSDAFVILLDTFHDGRNGYQFATNPAGAKWDAQLANEGRDFNVNWDGIWSVETRITETGWVAEVVIPFRTLKFADRDPQTWGINFRRKVRRLNEDSFWSPLPRIYGLERVSMAGTLDGLRGIRAGRNLRIKPYFSTSGSTVGRQPTRGDVDGGLDVKYGVTTGLVWDFTVNTDFSQVEADEQQVNLTRFNLFFPEKRDFFLENAGMFDFGSTGGFFGNNTGAIFYGSRLSRVPQMRLFFSRRIGLSEDGQALPIVAGTRLSGRAGAYSVGALNIQQGDAAGSVDANITAIRLRRNVLRNSDIGAVLLNKDEAGAGYNRMAGVDANFRFGYLTLNGVAGRSMSDTPLRPGAGNEYVGRSFAEYRDRTWRFRYGLDAIGGQFENDLGFTPQRGVHVQSSNVSRAFRPSWFPAWVRESQPHWEFELVTEQEDGSLDQRFSGVHLPLELSNGGFIEMGVNTYAEAIDVPFTLNPARRAAVSVGRHAFTEYFALVNGDPAAPVTPAVRYSFGTFYDGYKRSYSIGPSMRPNENLNASLNLQINDIDLPGVSFVSTLATARVNYSFTTSVFLNALLQYNTDTRQLSSNLRFNIIHRPLSDFFLVYNERRDERTNARLDRTLIAKFTYMLAM
jgi:hypothetical protein